MSIVLELYLVKWTYTQCLLGGLIQCLIAIYYNVSK